MPASLKASDGSPAISSIKAEIKALTTVTAGDLLFVGQVFRSRIRQRTFHGVDADGSPFAPYSTNGPYYFYPNRDAAGSVREGSADVLKARKTAVANRYAKTGREGTRTPYGIRYASYAAAKAAHGVSGVNLYGMEQHTHMLDAIIVRVAGEEDSGSTGDLDFGAAHGEFDAFESAQPAEGLEVGFYGPEAERAKGNNEGTKNSPARRFFALGQQDLQLAEQAIAQRMAKRAQSGGAHYDASMPAPTETITDDSDTWVPF